MANMCFNNMAVYGDVDELNALHAAIALATKPISPVAILLNAGYTRAEADEMVKRGFNFDDFNCGEIEDGKYGISYFQMSFSTSWSPIIEQWNDVLARFFPNLRAVTTAMEDGCEIYINTDTDGYFFPEHYYVDGSVNGHYTNETEDPYCETVEQVLGTINAMCEKAGIETFATIDDAIDFFDDEENNPSDQDFFLSVHEYTAKY